MSQRLDRDNRLATRLRYGDLTMPDLFGRNVSNLAGVFTADRAKLQWGVMTTGSLVQQLSVQYAQNVTRLYGVGEDDQYYVGGRTNGQMGVSRVIGPAGSSKVFYNTEAWSLDEYQTKAYRRL